MSPFVTPGQSSPLGATVADGGVNFSLFSRSATGVELLFFDRENDTRPARVIHLDSSTNRTYHYWHVFVPGVEPGQIYGYRVEGPLRSCQGNALRPAPKFSWTRMGAASLSPRITAVARPKVKATTPRRR